MLGATVRRLLVKAGDELRPGTPLFEVRVDLGASGEQDCPPVQHFRIVSTERAHVRELRVEAGDDIAAGALLGVCTTTGAEPADGPAARALRSMSVGIQIDPLAD